MKKMSENVLNESQLAEIIDTWYVDWKDRLVDFKTGTHSFGVAKEDLKGRIEHYPHK